MPKDNHTHHKHLLKFSEITKKDIPIAGGKGANLGEMIHAKIPVPDGFVVTTSAYYKFLDENNLRPFIKETLKGLDVEDSKKLSNASKKIMHALMKANFPTDITEDIKNQYHFLCGNKDKLVAVRSSATAEDRLEASFAGQQDTYLNVIGWKDVVKKTQECYASLFGARAIYYREKQKFDHFKVGIAVPVQLMIQSEISGIMFTVNPVTNNRDEISVEAGYGLGQTIVSGEVTPDQYIVSKKGLKIASKDISKQTWQLTKKGRISVSRDYQQKQKLSDKFIVGLAELGMRLENHYKHPQDIEWAYENKKLYIVQTRPVTTLDKKAINQKVADFNVPFKDILFKGSSASPGYASGPVKILKSAKEIDKVKDGDVLVTKMTDPDYVPAMRRACAIVTDEGGRTSHAAIVSRELGIPAVVGTNIATTSLKMGQKITVNGYSGEIYNGDYLNQLKEAKPHEDYSQYKNQKTATKVYLNLAEPHLAAQSAAMGVDGIGLLRAEFIIAQIGTHPRKFIEDKKGHEFTKKMVEGLETFAKEFWPRPIIYRATDFKTNEYANLKGGSKYEPHEENPLIGYRGTGRYIDDPQVFKLEVEAIKIVREKKGYTNLHVMLPFVRTVDELKNAKKLMSDFGLKRSRNFELYMMCEIPSNVILLEDFINVGIDGVSIGSNDLTMLTLGLDRDNPKIAATFDERNPAVLWMLEKIITTCKKNGIKCSICGQAPSTYPELIKSLVKWGATSVSVSPDIAYLARKLIMEAEFEIVRKKHS